ncbi:Glutathione S-transferase theta-1 [Asimina triloba]
MKLKVYADRLSQPSRAVLIFCKVNGIDFEEIRIDLQKAQHRTPNFKATGMKKSEFLMHGLRVLAIAVIGVIYGKEKLPIHKGTIRPKNYWHFVQEHDGDKLSANNRSENC